MKFFVSIVMFFLLLNVFATAQTLIQDSCKKAAAKDRNIKYDFCVNSLQADPASRTATSLDGLIVASTKSAASKMASLEGIVDNILKSKKYAKSIEMPLRDCLELYSDGKDSLNSALSSITAHDYVSVNVQLGAAADAPTTCETGFTELKQTSPLTNDNNVLVQKILIPLAFITM